MKLRTRIILTVLLWIGLPSVLGIYFSITAPSPPDKPEVLFILYTCFSWPIALLAFVMGSARQQLFHKPLPHRMAVQLGVYGLFAIILAMLTSPWLQGATRSEIFQLGSLGFLYCYLAGLFYWFVFIKAGKHE